MAERLHELEYMKRQVLITRTVQLYMR